MTEAANNLTLPRTMRILRKADFNRAFAARCTVSDPHLVIQVAANDLDHPRVGLVVGRRHGNAVKRNRLRRLLREAFRLEQHNIPAGLDYVLVPRPGAPADLETFRRSLLTLAPQAQQRCRRRSRHQPRPGEPNP